MTKNTTQTNTKVPGKTSGKPKNPSGKKPSTSNPCADVNTFLATIEKNLAKMVNTDIMCTKFEKLVSDAAKKYTAKESKALVKKAQGFAMKGVKCRGKVVTNISDLRRNMSRIRCKKVNGKNTISQIKVQGEQPALPKGFVVPRSWGTEWTPAWAKSHGWIKHPYYDWLMPVKPPAKPIELIEDVPSSDESDDVKEPPKDMRPRPTPVPGKEDKPETKEPETKEPDVKKPETKEPDAKKPDIEEPETDPNAEPDAEEPDANADAEPDVADIAVVIDTSKPTEEKKPDQPTKPFSLLSNKWFWIIGCSLMLLLAVLTWWWFYKSTSGQALGQASIDRAFDTSRPPTDIGFDNFDTGNDIPSTTDLMNDLNGGRSSPRKYR